MNYNNVKITILGHTCSGKSTYAQLIAKTLSNADIPLEIKDDISDGKLVISTNSARLKRLANNLKNSNGKVIIETKQARRTEKII